MNSTSSPSGGFTGWIRRTLLHGKNAVTNIHRPPFYFVLAAVLTFAVECLSRRSVVDAALFLWNRPLAFLTNYGIILLTVLPSLLFRKRVAGLALMTSIWTVLGIAQCVVLLSRVSPLTAVDVLIAFSVITIITSYLSIPVIILICAGLLSLLAGLVMLFVRARRYIVNWRKFAVVYASAFVGTALIIVSGFATGQLSDRFPNLNTAYNDYGFPYCFGMSIVDQGVDRPSDYGEELITDILGDMSGNEEPPADESAHSPNVIMVQLESFFDVKYLKGVTFSEDPVPGFTQLKEQYPSGYFTVPVIGAGTVNTEFEVLTGMSINDFGAGEYPFLTVIKNQTCETIAYDLLASGYHTHAIHNHEGSFYLRNEIYRNLGFEAFTSIEYFENPTYNENNWAHDALLTDEILYILNSTEKSDFVFAVSVQGHGKYPDEYIPLSGDVTVTGGMENETTRNHYNYYISQLHQMDAFVTALYEAVMDMEEDTVLVFYGDHLPSIVHDEGISVETGMFSTEYIIISNYETPTPATDEDLNAFQLFPTVMEVIGNDTGVMNRFHQTYRDDPRYLMQLAALEYDALYGKLMAYDGKPFPPTEMSMGSRPITVTGTRVEKEYLYITGENFTSFSRVALDGWSKDTEFVDSHTLRIKDKDPAKLLKKTESITVRQLSITNEQLSESPPYTGHREEG